jgi:hypothetical protein
VFQGQKFSKIHQRFQSSLFVSVLNIVFKVLGEKLLQTKQPENLTLSSIKRMSLTHQANVSTPKIFHTTNIIL